MDVAVLGAGSTGLGVAQVCAVAEHAVSLYATDVDDVMDGIDAIGAGLDDADDDGRLSGSAADDALDRIDGTTGLDAAVSGADIVVEATNRAPEQRRSLVADVEETVAGETLVGICGATLSVSAVAAGLKNPGRALGLQFIDPPDGTLVEVVVAEQTTEIARERAAAFVEGLGRDPLEVRDTPGFAATRLGLALTAEAVRMVEYEVAGVEAIDRAMTDAHGQAVGPLRAADEAGLDTRLAELEYLADALGERYEPPPVLEEKVAVGDLGRKTGEGFYVWESGEPTGPSTPNPTPEARADVPEDPDHR